MGRLFLIIAVVAVIVAFVAILGTIWTSVSSAGRDGLRSYGGSGKVSVMAPTTLQKISYGALLVLLLGVTTGWLGGL